jgi:hypothetical protein
MPDTKANVGIPLDATKYQHSLLAREVFHPPSLGSRSVSHTGSGFASHSRSATIDAPSDIEANPVV